MLAKSPELERAALAECLRQHQRSGARSALASAMIASALVVVVARHAPGLALWGWWLALLAVQGLRVGLWAWHRRAGAAAGDAARWLWRYRLSVLLHGLAWAALALAALRHGGEGAPVQVLFALAVVVPGSLMLTAFDPVAAAAFAAPPTAIALWVLAGPQPPLAQSATLLVLVLGVVATAVHSVVRARRDTADLLAAHLADERQAAESARLAEAAEAARRALAEKHHMLSLLLQTTHQGYWHVGPDGITIDVNPAMCRLLGRPREAVVGHPVTGFFDGEALDRLRRELAARSHGIAGSYEIDIVRPDGSVLHCLNNATPVLDSTGQRVGSVGLWTDITALREHERVLHTHELVMNSLEDVVSVVDEQQRYRLVNDAWCRATGLTREETIGRHAEALFPGVYTPARREAFERCLRERRPARVNEHVVNMPSLAGRAIESTYHPYADETGVRYVAIVSRDITEQEENRRQLAETAEYLKRTLNATDDAIFASDAADPHEPVRFANEPLFKLWGLPAELRHGLTPAHIMEHATPLFVDREAEVRRVREIVAHNVADETRLRLRDGRVIVRRCVPAQVGDRAMRVWSFRDITAETRALESAQADEAEQRALLDAFPGFIARLDAQGRYTYVNARMAALCGAAAEQVIGTRVGDTIGEAGGAAVLRGALQRVLAGGAATLEFHHAVPAPQGTDVQITVARGVHPGTGVPAIYAFGVDISDRKRAEDALISARDEAERANLAKSQFLSQMSHELRTPMNAIIGLGQLLVSDPLRPLVPTQQAYVNEMLRGARHLLALINEVLDLGRIEAGQLRVDATTMRLAQVVDECANLVRPLAAEHGVTITLPPPCGFHVRADRTRLKQVLLNLLGNAVKYNRRPGSVMVACGPDGDGVRIVVRDTGRGISAEDQARLFQPFERLGAARSGIEGTGIGLALSRRLVEAMGGAIGVESEPGIGSTFWVRLPRAEAAPPRDAAAAGAPALPAPCVVEPPPGAPTVLYIEDNPVNVFVMEALFERLPGYRLVCASTPAEGLQMARGAPPALILLDVQLPGMNGPEVLVRLQSDARTRDIPVVAVSANAMSTDIESMLASGARDYLTKPVELERLVGAVQRLVVPA